MAETSSQMEGWDDGIFNPECDPVIRKITRLKGEINPCKARRPLLEEEYKRTYNITTVLAGIVGLIIIFFVIFYRSGKKKKE